MLYFADFETTTARTDYFKRTGDVTVNIAGLMSQNKDFKVFSNLTAFIFFILKKLKSEDILYFHNLTFDGNFIFKWCFQNGFKPVNSVYEVKHKCIYMFRNGGTIYNIVLGWYNKQINIKCSYLLLCSSIDQIAKDLGRANKSEFIQDNPSFYDVEPRKNWWEYDKLYIEYLKNDIDVARVAVTYFFDTIKEKFTDFYNYNQVNKFLTTGAMSLKLQAHIASQFDINPKEVMYCSVDEFEFYKNWFFGGLTQFNPTIQGQPVTPQDGKVIDINSAYPYAMSQPLPVSRLYNMQTDSLPEDKPVYVYLHLKIKRASAKFQQTPFLRNWKAEGDNRYCLVLEDFECYYLQQEFDALCKYYHFEGVQIINSYWCEVKPFLSEYINTLYNLKTHFKKLKNESGSFTYKIFLNAGYGKYAQRWNLKSEFWVPAHKKNELILKQKSYLSKLGLDKFKNVVKRYDEYYIFELTKLRSYENVCGMSNVAVLKTKINQVNNILIAATITALNRVFMLETIYQLGPENFFYCDTDSIFFDAKNSKLDNIKIDKYELGAWDYEQNINTLVVLGAKAYYAVSQEKSKIKFSGINKKFLSDNVKLDWFLSTNQELTLKDATLKKQETPSGIVLVVDDYEIKKRSF